jgi:GTP-binding protein
MTGDYPLVVIVGRTNVGKSTLFNCLSGERVAIVDSTPGVTRDFLENFVTVGGKTIRLVDTGGLEIFVAPDNEIQREIETRSWTLLEQAHLVLFVVDGRSPLTQIEWELGAKLRRANLPTLLVVNKREGMTRELLPEEFLHLGIEKVVQISAQHGDGIAALKRVIAQELEDRGTRNSNPAQDAIHVAIVGKPNVGKSTLYNTLLQKDRAIVSDIPGTTRDALLSVMHTEYGKYAFLDTAGLARRNKTERGVGFYAHLRTKESIDKAQICILVIDPFQGITRQDQRIAQEIYEQKKCCLVFLNKMDLLPEGKRLTPENLKKSAQLDLNFLGYAVFLAGSAREKRVRQKLLATIAGIYTRYHQVIHPQILNGKIRPRVNTQLQKVFSGTIPLIHHITQKGVAPPAFIAYTTCIETRRKTYYARVLEKVLREEMDWEGVPIEIQIGRIKPGSAQNLP